MGVCTVKAQLLWYLYIFLQWGHHEGAPTELRQYFISIFFAHVAEINFDFWNESLSALACRLGRLLLAHIPTADFHKLTGKV